MIIWSTSWDRHPYQKLKSRCSAGLCLHPLDTPAQGISPSPHPCTQRNPQTVSISDPSAELHPYAASYLVDVSASMAHEPLKLITSRLNSSLPIPAPGLRDHSVGGYHWPSHPPRNLGTILGALIFFPFFHQPPASEKFSFLISHRSGHPLHPTPQPSTSPPSSLKPLSTGLPACALVHTTPWPPPFHSTQSELSSAPFFIYSLLCHFNVF